MIFKIGENKYSLKTISIIIFLLYPILSVPFFIIGILNRQRWAFILCALFMGLLAILYPPAGDLYRYAEDFNLYKDCDWSTFTILLVFKFDYFLPLISFCIGKLGGTVELTRFIFAFISYLLLFDLILLIVKDNKSLLERNIYIYALIILIPLTFWTFLFRYFFAVAFLLNGAYRWLFHNEKKGLLFVGLSILVHVSYLPFIFLCFFTKSKLFKFHYTVVVVLFVLAFVCDTASLGVELLSVLPFSDSLVNHIFEYIDGSQSEETTKDYSILQMLVYYISNIISLFIYYVYIRMYKMRYNVFMNMINVMLIVLLISASFPVIFGRLLLINLFFVKICMLISYAKERNLHRYFKYICYATIFLFMISCWQKRYFLSISYENRIFTSTMYDILSFSYSEEWINNNLNEDGDFYKRLNGK